MDPRRLAIFVAIVDEGGFTAAADELGVSQPAVSQAIRDLERQLGAILFHRIGRGVRLTSAGEALVAHARDVLRDLSLARLAVAGTASLASGRLDLACIPTLAAAPLAPLVGRFRSMFEGLTISLGDPEDTEELLSFIRSGRCELGLVNATTAEDLVTVPIGTQEFLVVLPPGAALRRTSMPIADLAALALVATPRGSSTRAVLDDVMAQAGCTPTVAVETSQREALVPLIATGAGAGLLPRPLAEMAARMSCTVLEPAPRIARPVVIVHRRAPLTPAAERFVALALEPPAG